MKLSKLINTSLALSYFFALSAIYFFYISDIYNYNGFEHEAVFDKIIFALLSIIFLYQIIGSSGFKDIYFHIMLSFTYIPSMVLFGFGGGSYDFFIYSFLCCFMVILSASFFRVRSITLFALDEKQFLNILCILSFLYIISIIANGGLRYWNLDINAVYDFRDLAAKNLPGIFNYLSPIFGKVVVPFLICISMILKKRLYLFVGICCSIVIFGLTAHKSPLFYPFVIMMIYYMAQFNLPKLLLGSLIIICAFSYIDFENVLGWNEGASGWIFGNFLSRRALMLPVLINSYFIDFFTSGNNYFWADSKFTFGLIDPPFDLSASFQISKIYFGSSEGQANTGWIGSGFGNAGLMGAMLYSVLIGYVLALFSSISKKVGRNFTISATFIVMFAIFTSTDFTTSLITHGLLFLIVFLLIVPSNISD